MTKKTYAKKLVAIPFGGILRKFGHRSVESIAKCLQTEYALAEDTAALYSSEGNKSAFCTMRREYCSRHVVIDPSCLLVLGTDNCLFYLLRRKRWYYP